MSCSLIFLAFADDISFYDKPSSAPSARRRRPKQTKRETSHPVTASRYELTHLHRLISLLHYALIPGDTPVYDVFLRDKNGTLFHRGPNLIASPRRFPRAFRNRSYVKGILAARGGSWLSPSATF